MYGYDGLEYEYDWETYPNFACITFYRESDDAYWTFEISEWIDQSFELFAFLTAIQNSGGVLVGYNSVGFDYPITHTFMNYGGKCNYAVLYNLCQRIIQSENRFENIVWESDRYIPQIDLMLIHHFDNKAKATSLKLLEFNMMMNDIQELPYDPRYPLTFEQARHIIQYNRHDVKATNLFKNYSREAIEFRKEISTKYDKDFMNANDTKIGAEIVAIELRKSGVKVNKYNQTIRTHVNVGDVIFDYVQFERIEFQQVLEYFRKSVIDVERIKGFFKEKGDENEETKFTSATIDGFTFDFGAGGIHGSIHNEIIVSDDECVIEDWDVEGYYPRLSVANKLYPAHLGPAWYETMDYLKVERVKVGKKTTLGGAYKLGVNGSYGKTNDKHSPFYDPGYTMAITINGQLLLCVLAEQLMKVPGLRMIQINTDGLTFSVPRQYHEHCFKVSKWWQSITDLKLEHVLYECMAVRDCNNYIAVTSNMKINDDTGEIIPNDKPGQVKRIGAYAYTRAHEDSSTRELPWNKNHSMVVVKKAAEAAILHGKDIREFITEHVITNPYDFFLRTKVPRSAMLYGSARDNSETRPYVSEMADVTMRDSETRLPNVTRYYVSNSGVSLIKVMSPTKKQVETWNTQPHWVHSVSGATKCAKKAPSGKWVESSKPSEMPPMREIGINTGFKVTEMNTIKGEVSLDDVNIDFYVVETEKLVNVFTE